MKTKNPFRETTVEFKHAVKGKIKFTVINNLPDIQGMSMEDAVYNWLARTSKYDAPSLCNYINSKSSMTGCKAFSTKEEYLKLKDR